MSKRAKSNMELKKSETEYSHNPAKSKKKALRAQRDEEFLHTIIEKNIDAILIVDRNGIVQFVNPAVETIFGKKAEEIVGDLFGYPLIVGKKIELDIKLRGLKNIIAEMFVTETEIEGETIYVVSLRDITDLVMMREKLRNMSYTDDLTGLYNRRGFFIVVQQQMKLARRHKRGMLLFFIDIDRLKWINDTFGHLEGDQALIALANILKVTFRSSDIITRYSGDEFLANAIEAKREGADIIAKRLQENIDAYNKKEKLPCKISVGFGIEYYDPEEHRSIYELITRADKLMYKQKQEKR